MEHSFLSIGNGALDSIENSDKISNGSIGNISFNTYDEIFSVLKDKTHYNIPPITDNNSVILPKDSIGKLEFNPGILQYNRIIIGKDDRIIVESNYYPYNCIALLIIYDKNGNKYTGTGFFISKNCVATAGHCVFFNKNWASKIIVIPGAVGNISPYGEFVSKRFRSVQGWVGSNDKNLDYGAIILDDHDSEKRPEDYFGYTLDIDENNPVEISGYPSDKNDIQWKCEGKIFELTPERIYYKLDTYEGNSGSPLFFRNGDNALVIGVHSYGENPNYSIRLNQDIINRWSEWSNI
jgi:V8-like Glu-specific endopeptidase